MNPDFHDTAKVEKRLRDATNRLHAMVNDVALARQIKEFSSDQRKTILARYVAPLLAAGQSAVAAEAMARASDEYRAEAEIHAKQYQHAEKVIATWYAVNATWEAARSLFSMSKETMKQLNG